MIAVEELRCTCAGGELVLGCPVHDEHAIENRRREKIAALRSDPAAFVRDVLGIELTPQQHQLLASGGTSIAVRLGARSGRTWAIAEATIAELRSQLHRAQVSAGRANNARQAAEAELRGAVGTRGKLSHKKRVRRLCKAAIALAELVDEGASAEEATLAVLDAAQRYGAAVIAGRKSGPRRAR